MVTQCVSVVIIQYHFFVITVMFFISHSVSQVYFPFRINVIKVDLRNKLCTTTTQAGTTSELIKGHLCN